MCKYKTQRRLQNFPSHEKPKNCVCTPEIFLWPISDLSCNCLSCVCILLCSQWKRVILCKMPRGNGKKCSWALGSNPTWPQLRLRCLNCGENSGYREISVKVLDVEIAFFFYSLSLKLLCFSNFPVYKHLLSFKLLSVALPLESLALECNRKLGSASEVRPLGIWFSLQNKTTKTWCLGNMSFKLLSVVFPVMT